MDDPLTMVHLFAALPAEKRFRIPIEAVSTARRLALEFQAYVVRAHALRKVFVSVKGFYYQVCRVQEGLRNSAAGVPSNLTGLPSGRWILPWARPVGLTEKIVVGVSRRCVRTAFIGSVGAACALTARAVSA